jgi:hypothetical protein
MASPSDGDLTHEQQLDMLNEHARAVGMLCMYWSFLDRTISFVIERLLDQDEKTVACILTSANDTSQKCEMARRLAFLKADGPDWQEWRECMVGLLDHVQNDRAFVGPDMLQFDRRAKIGKSQSFQPAKLVHISERRSKPSEIGALWQHVCSVFIAMGLMSDIYRIGRKLGRVDELSQVYDFGFHCSRCCDSWVAG